MEGGEGKGGREEGREGGVGGREERREGGVGGREEGREGGRRRRTCKKVFIEAFVPIL